MEDLSFAELVFGFVYAIGTDVDPVIRVLKNYLKQYGYKAEEFRISKKLRSLELGIPFEQGSGFDRMNALMDAGNEVCARAADDRVLAVMAINDIASHRAEDEQKRPVARTRTAHIIRSLKRPEEVRLLREVYRPGFFLIGVADDEDSQSAYLTKELGLDDHHAKAILERDQDEDQPHGQRTRRTFYLADIFVQLHGEVYKKQIERFLEIVFGHPFKTPTREEHAMFMAYASAARSAQLGRQVGAAITSADGQVISVGMNEVPSSNGGPYWEGDVPDHRDHEKKIDSNFEHRNRIVQSIVKKLRPSLMIPENVLPLLKQTIQNAVQDVEEAAKDELAARILERHGKSLTTELAASSSIHSSDLRDITEYGRAVHGEMDAILSCTRLGISPNGKYLFVTTFPCHNCTRHIIAAGIKKVYYIEPYPKSRARDLHSDAICFDEREGVATGKIPFLPFVGIGPRRYLDLFSLELSSGRDIARKDDRGFPIIPPKKGRPPRVPMLPLSYLEREDKLMEEFRDVLQELQGVSNGKNPSERSQFVKPSHRNRGKSK